MRTATRYLLITCGVIALVLGLIGVVLPLVPTTPFLLVASACFLRGSQRLHDWLTNHPVFGCYLRDYHAGLGVPMRMKLVALATIWVSIPGSVAIMYLKLGPGALWAGIAITLATCAVTVTWYLIGRLPTRPADAECTYPVARGSE
jgi:uncharacterized protein